MSKKVCPPPASLTEYVNTSISINNEVDGNMELAIFVGSIVVLAPGFYSLSLTCPLSALEQDHHQLKKHSVNETGGQLCQDSLYSFLL